MLCIYICYIQEGILDYVEIMLFSYGGWIVVGGYMMFICIGFEVNDLVLCIVKYVMGKCGIIIIEEVYYGNFDLIVGILVLLGEVLFLGEWVCMVFVFDSYLGNFDVLGQKMVEDVIW